MGISELSFSTNTAGYGERNLILDNNTASEIRIDPKLYKQLMAKLDDFSTRHKNTLIHAGSFIDNWQKLNSIADDYLKPDKTDIASSGNIEELAYLSYTEIFNQQKAAVTQNIKSMLHDLVVISDFANSNGILNYQLTPEIREQFLANNAASGASDSDSPANINVLLLITQATISVMNSNSIAAKIVADSAQLLNRVINVLSALSELLAQINAMYGTGLSAKQKDEISKGASGGAVSTTISWDDLVNNTKGDYTPDNNAAHFNGGTRNGFFVKGGSELLAMLSGMFGGSFDYMDKFHTDDQTNYYWDDKKNEWVEYTTKIPDPQQVSDRSGKDIFKDGYIFIDTQAMQSIVRYVSQLVALALPSSSGNPDGDLQANFRDSWQNNTGVQSLIDNVSNLIKQLQGLLSSISNTVSLDQAAINDMLKILSSILSGWQSLRNMLGT